MLIIGVNNPGDKWENFETEIFSIFVLNNRKCNGIDENPGQGVIAGVNDSGKNLAPEQR